MQTEVGPVGQNGRVAKLAAPRIRLLTLATAFSCLGLVALASAMFISADLTETTYATTSIADTTTSESTINLTGDSYVTISASDVVISLTPDSSSGSSTAYAKTTVTLESSSTDSIQLYLSMSGNTTSLYKDGDTSSSSPAIDATTTTGSLDNFLDNTWGYSLDNADYQAVPDSSSAMQIASLDSSGTVTQDIYYGIKINSNLSSGTYSNSVTYTATVNNDPITTTADLTKIEVFGTESNSAMVVGTENTITVTTNIKTNTHGEPRVYYVINDGENSPTYQECSTVQASQNNEGYLQIVCTVTPTTTAADGDVTLYITTKGGEDDYYCTEGLYSSDSSDCEAGNWKWGSFTIALPKIRLIFDGITTMQAMTTSICSTAITNETTRLKDERDDKYYWVAKLADGNCWMTQNLDFDLTSSTVLYDTDSDVSDTVDFSQASYDVQLYTEAQDGSVSSYHYIYTWDLGDYVILDPTTNSPYCSGIITTNLSACDNARFASTEGKSARTYITDYSNTSTSTADDTSYDAHYLIGNYYTWNAATAGSGTDATNQYDEASDSICPAGWELPSYNSTTGGSFYALIDGLTSSALTIASAPYYFVRGGFIDSSGLYGAGNYASYWSRTAYSSDLAYYLYFAGNSNANPSFFSFRFDGFSVRCVAS